MSELISVLVEQLGSDDAGMIASAAQALAQANQSIQAAAIPLVNCLGTIHDDSNEWIVAALEQLESPSAADADAFAHVMQSYADGEANSQQAYWAAKLLGRIGPEAGNVSCQALARCASSAADPEIVTQSVWALSKMGASAASAQAVLQQLSQSPVPRTARYAQQALDNLGSANS